MKCCILKRYQGYGRTKFSLNMSNVFLLTKIFDIIVNQAKFLPFYFTIKKSFLQNKMIYNDDFKVQNIWVIGSTTPLIHAEYQPNSTRGQIINIAISKTHVYFAIKDQIGSFKISGTSEEITKDKITYEPAKDIVQVVCGNEYVAYRTTGGDIYARGNPFPATFTKIRNKKEADMPAAVSITGTPYFIFAIISQGRFCIISGNSVIYHKKRIADRWYISSTMFLGTVLLLGHTGRAYTMSFNESNPTLSNTLQVFSEDPCVFTSLFSCHESLFFLTVDDYVVSYGYNHHGCLGVGHENTVSTLVRFHPPMNGECIFEIAPSSDFTFFLTQNGNLYVSGQSPFDKTTTSQPVIFKPLEGKRITQIRTCGAVCAALENGHKDYNSTSTPPEKYKQFPITVIPTCYTGILGGPSRVLPFPQNFTRFFYQPGDIVARKETKGKVIGLSTKLQPMIAIAHLKRVMLLENDLEVTDTEFTDFLLRRPGHRMLQAIMPSKSSIYIDVSDTVISQFGGFKFGDLVETKSGTKGIVFGARGEFLWIKPNGSNFVVNVKENELSLLSRKKRKEGEKEDILNSIELKSQAKSQPTKTANSSTSTADNSTFDLDLSLSPPSSKNQNQPKKQNINNNSSEFELFLNTFSDSKSDSNESLELVPFDLGENNRFWAHPITDKEQKSIDVNKNDLFFLPELGLCQMVGYTDNHQLFFYRRVDESSVYVKTAVKAPCVRRYKNPNIHHTKGENSSANSENDHSSSILSYSSPPLPSYDSPIVLTDMTVIEGIETSYEETLKSGFLTYDRISTQKGLATVIGIHSEKVVAITDEMYVSNGLADIFDANEVEVVARVDDKPFHKKFRTIKKSQKTSKSDEFEEIDLLINVSAFIDNEFIVQDRICIVSDDGTSSNGFIVGITDDKTVFVKMDNEDYVKPLNNRCKLVARYLHIMASEVGINHMNSQKKVVFKSMMNAAGTIVKPGDVICHEKETIKSTVCGFTSNGDIALNHDRFDDNGFFVLNFQDITYHNIKFDVPSKK